MTARRRLTKEEVEEACARLDAMPLPDRMTQCETIVGILSMQLESLASTLAGIVEVVERDKTHSAPESSGGYI